MKEINIREIGESPVKLLADEWALLTAGGEGAWNTMTVSWGGVGELWGKDVTFVFVRHQRYTKEFMEKNDYFSLCFFGEEHKSALRLCGKTSGRDTDKAQATGLTPVFDGDATYFEQAKLTIICKKIAKQDMDPNGFLDKSIMDCYKANDFHTTYVGEIVKVLKK